MSSLLPAAALATPKAVRLAVVATVLALGRNSARAILADANGKDLPVSVDVSSISRADVFEEASRNRSSSTSSVDGRSTLRIKADPVLVSTLREAQDSVTMATPVVGGSAFGPSHRGGVARTFRQRAHKWEGGWTMGPHLENRRGSAAPEESAAEATAGARDARQAPVMVPSDGNGTVLGVTLGKISVSESSNSLIVPGKQAIWSRFCRALLVGLFMLFVMIFGILVDPEARTLTREGPDHVDPSKAVYAHITRGEAVIVKPSEHGQ